MFFPSTWAGKTRIFDISSCMVLEMAFNLREEPALTRTNQSHIIEALRISIRMMFSPFFSAAYFAICLAFSRAVILFTYKIVTVLKAVIPDFAG